MSNFKVGDSVKILREVREVDGVDMNWTDAVTRAVGRPFQIKGAGTRGRVILRGTTFDIHVHPSALELVSVLFKPGDRVVVTDKPERSYPNWVKDMDKYVGKVFEVKEVNPNSVTFKGTTPYCFPLGCLEHAPGMYPPVFAPISALQPSQPQIEETQMNTVKSAPAVEVITRIYGVDSDKVSDAEIFNHIAAAEAKIKSLSAIENKPKKLVAQIAALQADIDALVKFSDSRE